MGTLGATMIGNYCCDDAWEGLSFRGQTTTETIDATVLESFRHSGSHDDGNYWHDDDWNYTSDGVVDRWSRNEDDGGSACSTPPISDTT